MTTKTQPLSATQILNKILHTKGQFIKVFWKSNPSPAAKHKDIVLEKVTEGVCRAGIEYQNLKPVKEAIESGEKEAIEQLPFGTWLVYPYLITHKETTYVRLYPSESNKPKSKFFVNGEEVTKEVFAEYLTPSEAKKLLEPKEKDKPLCFTVKLENILGEPTDFES